ncbi:MAG: nucleoside recognition domain-containing protein [Candidatus Limimorpha sp.]
MSDVNTFSERMLSCIRSATTSALKIIAWLVKIMVGVSFGIMLLKYFGIIGVVSRWLTPVFSSFGLPGEAALAYVSGYFVNCYTAMAVMSAMDLGPRSTTILAVMVLCSHNIIVESTVQHKTGSSMIRIIIVRTLSAFFLGFILNLIMPGRTSYTETEFFTTERLPFLDMFLDWIKQTVKTVSLMVVLVYLLSLLQRILKEFGVIEAIARFLRPIMLFFGLPPETAFLWLVANTLGLAYGAAVMIDETEQGTTTKEQNDILNHHICVSHSNLEDLLLFTAIGGNFLWMLLSRWAMSLILVWERKLERLLLAHYSISQ